MKAIEINDKISYIECSENPLSAGIGIVKAGSETWLFDVGNDVRNLEGLEEFGGMDGQYHIVLSHFHLDHVGSLDKLGAQTLYVSKETKKHVSSTNADVILVEEDLYIGNLHIFPLRSSHAKGCLALEVDEQYCFVGEALYGREKGGHYGYNAQLLKEGIDKLKSIKSPYLLLSHRPGMIQKKDGVIAWLESIYAKRIQGNPEIWVER